LFSITKSNKELVELNKFYKWIAEVSQIWQNFCTRNLHSGLFELTTFIAEFRQP